MIKLRYALSADFEMLADLGRRAFFEAFGAYSDPQDMQAYLDLAFHPDSIRRQLEDPSIIYIIALYQETAVGYAKMKRNSAPPELKDESCIQLERIYALQAYVGKKVGKTMMEECTRKSKSENFRYLWLGVWQQNERAIAFYKKWNFKVIGYKQFVIGKEVNDDFVMAMDLQGDGSSLKEIETQSS